MFPFVPKASPTPSVPIPPFPLYTGTKRQPLSMTLLHAQMASYLSSSLPPSTLTPHHLIKSRKPVQPGQSADVIFDQSRLEGTTDSWRNWAEGKVVEGWRESVAEVYVPPVHPGYPIHMLNERWELNVGAVQDGN